MKLAPLQLERYFLTDLTWRANQDYKRDKPTTFQENDLAVATELKQIQNQKRRWQVTLKIQLQPPAESNSPYLFTMVLVGVIWAAPELAEGKLEAIVRTNGPTMLYGVAREMARDITARGPYPALLLPSVSFLVEAATSQQNSGQPATSGDKPTAAPSKQE